MAQQGDGTSTRSESEPAHAHERLVVYQLALKIARWAAKLHVPAVRRHLKDQIVRAADSAVLNIAEGSGRGPGDARRNHFRIAGGSAAEVGAVIDLLQPSDGPEYKRDTVGLARMLTELARG